MDIITAVNCTRCLGAEKSNLMKALTHKYSNLFIVLSGKFRPSDASKEHEDSGLRG